MLWNQGNNRTKIWFSVWTYNGLYNIVYTSFDKQNPLLWNVRDCWSQLFRCTGFLLLRLVVSFREVIISDRISPILETMCGWVRTPPSFLKNSNWLNSHLKSKITKMSLWPPPPHPTKLSSHHLPRMNSGSMHARRFKRYYVRLYKSKK